MFDIYGLYGKTANAGQVQDRIDNLERNHITMFGVKPEVIISTSGRTELGGNHTDHNCGKVLAGAIDLDTIAAVHCVPGNMVSFYSEGYDLVRVNLSDTAIHSNETGSTASLIRGIAASIVRRDGQIGGFCANVSSNVLKGSGLSSSAAIEVLVGTIFNVLFNNGTYSTTELAIMGQEAENDYFGKPSGLMDQVACANGGIVGIDFKDPRNPRISPIAVDFADYGYDLVITSTGGNHADLTADYASIPVEMKAVAAFFGKNVLREVDPNLFLSSIGTIRSELGNDRAILRAMHFFEENKRVDRMIAALANKDFRTYLDLVTESGSSSFRYLQNIYSPTASSEQGISIAYSLTEAFLRGEGAFRVQGGGFAGTIQAYVPCDRTRNYYQHMEKVFGPGCCTTLAIRNLPTCRIR